MDKYAQRPEELGSEWKVWWMAAGLHCPEEAAQGSSWAEDHCLGSRMAHRAKAFSFLQNQIFQKAPVTIHQGIGASFPATGVWQVEG